MVLSCVPLVWEYVYASYKQCLAQCLQEPGSATLSVEDVEVKVLKLFAEKYFGGQLACVGTGGAATRYAFSYFCFLSLPFLSWFSLVYVLIDSSLSI
jgi:hypothetical protein